jgi:hypothetical protein
LQRQPVRPLNCPKLGDFEFRTLQNWEPDDKCKDEWNLSSRFSSSIRVINAAQVAMMMNNFVGFPIVFLGFLGQTSLANIHKFIN